MMHSRKHPVHWQSMGTHRVQVKQSKKKTQQSCRGRASRPEAKPKQRQISWPERAWHNQTQQEQQMRKAQLGPSLSIGGQIRHRHMMDRQRKPKQSTGTAEAKLRWHSGKQPAKLEPKSNRSEQPGHKQSIGAAQQMTCWQEATKPEQNHSAAKVSSAGAQTWSKTQP